MKGKIVSLIIGLLFLAACGVFVAQMIFDIEIFSSINGWWTVFIIVPGLLGLLQRGARISSLGVLLVGCALLTREQGWFGGILNGASTWQIIVAAVLLVVGLSIIRGVFCSHKIPDDVGACCGSGAHSYCGGDDATAVFSNRKFDYSGKEFKGIDLTGVFGTVELDLRTAIITENCTIEANSVFGTVVIYTGDNASYKTYSSTVFGDVIDKSVHSEIVGLPEVSVRGNAVFGNIELR